MTKVFLLDALKGFTEAAIKDLIMPVRKQKGDAEQQYRVAEVHTMRLPNSREATKKAPYIIHQVILSNDEQKPGERPSAQATVRSIFCVYNDNEEEGSLMLLNLMERVRIAILRAGVIADNFQLNLEKQLETMTYTDDTAPYYAGEMKSVWDMPPVEREVRKWLEESPPPPPHP